MGGEEGGGGGGEGHPAAASGGGGGVGPGGEAGELLPGAGRVAGELLHPPSLQVGHRHLELSSSLPDPWVEVAAEWLVLRPSRGLHLQVAFLGVEGRLALCSLVVGGATFHMEVLVEEGQLEELRPLQQCIVGWAFFFILILSFPGWSAYRTVRQGRGVRECWLGW